jgi:hypothetical protein
MTAILAVMMRAIQPVAVDATSVLSEGSGAQTATFQVDNDGTLKDQLGATLRQWLLGGTAADYDVMATLVSGDTPSGSPLGTWLNCGTDRSWSLTAVTGGKTCELTVSIGHAGTSTALASGSITISALVT